MVAPKSPKGESMRERTAFWTFDPDGHRAYYFAPSNRAAPPYHRQIEVTAILDIASDGTLAGVELVMGDLPPPPIGVGEPEPSRLGDPTWPDKVP